MFEDSMMESGGKIKTKSKYWMIAHLCLQRSDPGDVDPDPAALSRGAAEDGDDGDADGSSAPTTAAAPTAAGADRQADQDGVGDRSGSACADQDPEGHQDAEGRCRASAAGSRCSRHGRHGRRSGWRRAGRRAGWPGHGAAPVVKRAPEADWPGQRVSSGYDCRHRRSRSRSPSIRRSRRPRTCRARWFCTPSSRRQGTIENLRSSADRRCCEQRAAMRCREALAVQAVPSERRADRGRYDHQVNFTFGG